MIHEDIFERGKKMRLMRWGMWGFVVISISSGDHSLVQAWNMVNAGRLTLQRYLKKTRIHCSEPLLKPWTGVKQTPSRPCARHASIWWSTNTALRIFNFGTEWSVFRFTPWGNSRPVHTEAKAGWTPQPVWKLRRRHTPCHCRTEVKYEQDPPDVKWGLFLASDSVRKIRGITCLIEKCD